MTAVVFQMHAGDNCCMGTYLLHYPRRPTEYIISVKPINVCRPIGRYRHLKHREITVILKHNTSFDVCFISGCERLIACAKQYRVLELWKGYWASVTFRVGPCGLWTRQVCSPILLRRLLLTQSGAFQWREHPPNFPIPWGM